MLVNVDTDLLVSGGSGVLDSLSKCEGPYEAVANAQCGDVASFASFKKALNQKFDTFSEHSTIMGNRLQECGNCLDDVDNLIGNSADGNLVGADSLTFSKDGLVVAGINEDDASSDSKELDENSELDTYSSDLVVSSNLKPKNNSGIAHRGHSSSSGIGQNSANDFINAGKSGFWGCESDVRFDNAGNLICSHNVLKNGETATSFEEYLDICKEYGMTAIIDLKYARGVGPADPDLSPQVIKTIQEKGMMDSCILQTNNMTDIPYIRETSSDARIWMLTDYLDNNRKNLIDEYNVECVNIKASTEGLNNSIKYLDDKGVDVCVWNVFDEGSKDRYLNAGATYVMSDNLIGITPYQEGEEDFNNIAN